MLFAAIGCPPGCVRGFPLVNGRVVPTLSCIDGERSLHVDSVKVPFGAVASSNLFLQQMRGLFDLCSGPFIRAFT
jgi:hypothetical protein